MFFLFWHAFCSFVYEVEFVGILNKKGIGMLKKILLLSVLVAMVFVTAANAQESNVSSETQISEVQETVVKENIAEVAIDKTEENSDFLAYDSPELIKPIDMKSSAIRAGSSLLFVIALLGGFVFFLKFVLNKKDKPFFKERMLNVLERNYIEPKKTIMLVRAMNKLLVIGVAGDNINVLSEITDPEVVNKAISGDFYGYMKKYTSLEDKKEI